MCSYKLPDEALYCPVCGEQQEIDDMRVNAVERKNEEMTARKKITSKEYLNDLGMFFRKIPVGVFHMGSRGWEDSQPCHPVRIDEPFYMGVFPVTQWEWEFVTGDNPSRFKGDERPVEMVSSRDSREFISRLNAMENTDRYRLPSEVEWEYACRARDRTDYYFHNDVDTLEEYAWFVRNSAFGTHEVGQKRANKWGLHDMLGNVWEWCEDSWHDDYNGAPLSNSIWRAGKNIFQVDRGGSWDSTEDKCLSAYRDWNLKTDRAPYLGLRLAFSV